jgi:hypothetical protein
MTHDIRFLDRGREPQCPPNPKYPNGIDIDMLERPACLVKLPYPAKRCGVWIIECSKCGRRDAVTTAGRRDDPRSYMMPCGEPLNAACDGDPTLQ